VVVGCLRVSLAISEAHSLKEKRSVVRRVVERTHNKFHVAVAEVETQDDRRLATLGVVCVSNSHPLCQSVLQQVLEFIEGLGVDAEVRDVQTETLNVL